MWSITRIRAAILVLLALGVCSVSDARGTVLTEEEEAYLDRKGPIVFVSQSRYPPFEFRGRGGGMDGMTVDLIHWMAAEFGLKVQNVGAPFFQAQEAVLSRSADVITGIFYSDQRAAMFSFTEKMFEVPASIYVVSERTDIRSLEDLEGKRVAVQAGGYERELLAARGDDIEVIEAKDTGGALHLVMEGKADALIGAEQVVLHYAYRHSERDRIKRVGTPLYVGEYCMATRKGDARLAAILSKCIGQAKEQGVLETISRKWLGEPISTTVSPLSRYIPFLLSLALIVIALILTIWIWNLKLRQQVALRTSELMQSESRLRAMFSAAEHVAFVISDLKGDDAYIHDFSPGAEKIFGYRAEEVIGMPVSTLHIAANAQRVKELVSRLKNERRGFAGEIEMERKSGERFSAILNTYPLEDSHGDVVSTLGVALDISDLKQAQERVRESEERYKAIFEHAADGLILMDPETAEILEFNQRACDHLGYTKKEFSELSIEDIDESALPDEIAKRNKEVVRTGSDSFETKQRRKNGDEIDAMISRRVVMVGGRQVIMSVWRDITEQKQVQRAIETAKNEWETTFDSVPDLICMINMEHCLTRVNLSMAAHLGLSAQECVGRKYHECIYGSDEPPAECPHSILMDDGVEHVADMHLDRFGGDFVVTASPLHDQDGRLKGSIFIARDVTVLKEASEERRKLEAQVQQTQKLESLGVLAGGIAHDFNNLLMGILGNADLAMEELPNVSPAKRGLDEIVTSAKRAADLCRQMLAYSGKGQFLIQAVDANEIVEEMTRLLEVSVSKMAILRYGLAPNLPAIMADATQIRQVVMNLITNASEAIGTSSGVISVCTGAVECERSYLDHLAVGEKLPPGLYVYVEVSDTGMGMDEETKERIFDPFFTTKFTGRGLGLAAVHGIVRGHRGALDVKSEPGRGTTIRVLFPAVDEPACSTDADLPDLVEHASGTVLLVDDEETVRTIGKRMLEKVGFSVFTAADGREAVDIVKEKADILDCVVLDLTMPHMDGEEAFQTMRRIKPDIRVLVSSGYSEQEIDQRFASAELAGFLQKPYRLKTLSAKLLSVMNKSPEEKPLAGHS